MAAIEIGCNYRCPYCIASCNILTHEVVKEMKAGLTTDHWVEWWTWIGQQEFDEVSVQITGGEPLTHPGFVEIAQSISRLKGRHDLCTNLSLEKPLEPFVTGEIRGWCIAASVHPWNSSFNSVRYIELITALKVFHKVVVVFVDVVENHPWKDEMIELFKEHQVDYVLLNDERPVRIKDYVRKR